MSIMTQDHLIQILTQRGWRVTETLENVEKYWQESRGISIHAISPNDYVLSIQAGEGLYSEPRRMADSYTEVEFAIWKAQDRDGKKKGKFIRDSRLFHSVDDVVAYAEFKQLMIAIEVIEGWTLENAPDRLSIHRTHAPHRDIN